MSKVKGIFLDRDGIINKDTGYVYKKEDFIFKKNIFSVLKYLQKKNFLLFIITNQSGIGRGYYSIKDFLILNDWMIKEFEKNSIKISSVQFCPHTPNSNCLCRKPKTKMFDEINKSFSIDKENSWMIGDKESDIEFAINCGIRNTIFLKNSKNSIEHVSPNYKIKSLNFIKKII